MTVLPVLIFGVVVLLLFVEGLHVLITMTKAKGIIGFILFFVPIYPWYYVIKNKKTQFEKDWAAIPWVIFGILATFYQIYNITVTINNLTMPY